MTNAEWIRSMSDEELAIWLHNICAFVSLDNEPYLSVLDSKGNEAEIYDSYGNIVDWLREEKPWQMQIKSEIYLTRNLLICWHGEKSMPRD